MREVTQAITGCPKLKGCSSERGEKEEGKTKGPRGFRGLRERSAAASDGA
eukprot:gene12927-47033_t